MGIRAFVFELNTSSGMTISHHSLHIYNQRKRKRKNIKVIYQYIRERIYDQMVNVGNKQSNRFTPYSILNISFLFIFC